MKTRYIIGVDEVGRGPLAGPVGVGIACVPTTFDWKLLPGVTDSKKLTPQKRFEIYTQATTLKKAGVLDWQVAMVSASVIDQIGIVPAIKVAMRRGLNRMQKSSIVNRTIFPEVSRVLLDGGLTAPTLYTHQETIIKGDAREPIIGLASIVAKVTRDRYMERVGKQADFRAYDFAQHKGYGTKAHRSAIAHNGLSSEHRRSYCGNIKVLYNVIAANEDW